MEVKYSLEEFILEPSKIAVLGGREELMGGRKLLVGDSGSKMKVVNLKFASGLVGGCTVVS